MVSKQINLKLPKELLEAAEIYARDFGYRNIQELASDSIREKVFQSKFDNSFTDNEIQVIDSLIGLSVKKGEIASEEELMKALE